MEDFITDNGGSEVTEKGVCRSQMRNPSLADFHTKDGSGDGSYVSTISGLTPNETYYVRAYATNIMGTNYGNELSFTTFGRVTDFDGNTYKTVQIGDQIWIQENLNVTHYSNGTSIPLVQENTKWKALGTSEKAYCWYDNNPTNAKTYGALYTWAAAINGMGGSNPNPSAVQGVCPNGWHLPSDAEWKQLEIYLGLDQRLADTIQWRGIDVGGKLKDSDNSFWASPNIDASNESGFKALPGGKRYFADGAPTEIKRYAYFWTSTDKFDVSSVCRMLSTNSGGVWRGWRYDNDGYSVRCVKN